MKINQIENFPNGIAIKWTDDRESFIEYKTLRLRCPCAYCSGEKDALGNVYKGKEEKLSDAAIIVQRFEHVGHYAIRIFWGDNHNSGIYTFDYLRNLDLF